MLFLYGFLTAWFIFSAVILFCEETDKYVTVIVNSNYEQAAFILLTLPAFIPAGIVFLIVRYSKLIINKVKTWWKFR